jgi:hypothetical protein
MNTINLGMYKNNRFQWIARIEVLFWRLFIWTIKSMKISRITFVSGLVLVAALGGVIYFSLLSRNVYSELSHKAPINLTSGQRNTLLVLVNDGLEPTPQLRSIWLLLELPGKTSFTLIPLYPAAVKNYAIHDRVLEQSFAVNDNRTLDESFLTNLSKLNIWWNDYLVIDDYILGSLYELTNGSSIDGKKVSGDDIRSGGYPSAQSKTEQLNQQVFLIKYFCQKITLAPLHPNFQNSVASFSSHTISSLKNDNLAQWLVEINHISTTISCDFPTLNATQASDTIQDLN